MAEIYQLTENGNSNGNATIPFSIPIGFCGYGGNGMFGNGNGFNSIADLFGLAYGESWHGEPSAYLVGFMTKEIVEIIGEPCN